jgi:hypothetical protein
VKVGDLVKRKRLYGYLAIVLEHDDDQRYGDYIKFAIVDSGKVESASAFLFEVINESR